MFRVAFLFSVLLLLVGLLIALPAYIFDQLPKWQVLFAIGFYLAFFSATAWRGVIHGKLAKDKDDKQLKNDSGKIAFAARGVGLLVAHWLAVYEFSIRNSNDAVSAFGIGVMTVGLIVNRLAAAELGKFWDKLVIKENHQLITNGIYAVVRHPIYSSYILIFLGYVALLNAPISAVLFALVSVVWFGNRIALEEAMLTEKFGDDYRQYISKTKRLFPYLY